MIKLRKALVSILATASIAAYGFSSGEDFYQPQPGSAYEFQQSIGADPNIFEEPVILESGVGCIAKSKNSTLQVLHDGRDIVIMHNNPKGLTEKITHIYADDGLVKKITIETQPKAMSPASVTEIEYKGDQAIVTMPDNSTNSAPYPSAIAPYQSFYYKVIKGCEINKQ